MKILAQLVTASGQNVRSIVSTNPDDMWSPLRFQSWAIPAAEVRSTQPADIPVRLRHGGPPVGRITHLEHRASDGSLWAVADAPDDLDLDAGRDYFLSVEATFDQGTGADIEITGAALCERSRMIAIKPCTFVRADGLDLRGRRPTGFQADLLDRAKRLRYRDRGRPIRVRTSGELEGQRLTARAQAILVDQQYDELARRPPGKLRYRPSRITAVR